MGDKICYPMQGAGFIDGIEQRTVLGNLNDYYNLKFHSNDIRIMVPINNAQLAGLRHIMDKSSVASIFTALEESTIEEANWNRRYRANCEKIKKGKPEDIIVVIYSLEKRNLVKTLSTLEKKMLSSAKSILISELVVCGWGDEDEALELIEKKIKSYL